MILDERNFYEEYGIYAPTTIKYRDILEFDGHTLDEKFNLIVNKDYYNAPEGEYTEEDKAGAVFLWIQYLNEFIDTLDGLKSSTNEAHCAEMTWFSTTFTRQSSISAVANEWHCDWNHVLNSEYGDVMITLDFLQAKSYADAMEQKWHQQRSKSR